MTCTCEGLKNVASQPSLHSPGVAAAGPVSNRVLAGWGDGLCPVFAGRLGLPPHPLSEPRHLLQTSTWLHIGVKEKSVCPSPHQLIPLFKGDSGSILSLTSAVPVAAL